MKTRAVNDNQLIIKAYVDQFHQGNEKSRRESGIDFYDESIDLVKNNQDNDFNDKKITNIDSMTVNRKLSFDNEPSKKKYIVDELDKNTILRLNGTLQFYLKVSVGNETYSLTKYNKISITDITKIKFPNTSSELLQKWNIYCNNKINQSRKTDLIRSTKTSSPPVESGATSLPPIGDSFMYIETSSNNHSENAYVSFEKSDIIQITEKTFYYNRYSILTHDHLKNMVCLRVQLLLGDDTWSTVDT